MKIFVDADACPVVRIVEKIAEKYKVPVTLPRRCEEEVQRII